MGLYYQDNQGDFVIVVTAKNVAGCQQLMHLIWILVGTFILGLLMIFLIGQWYAHRSLQPINHINSEVQNIRATNLHLRVHRGRNADEVDELARNFNELLEHLEKAFAMQQSFVAHASHELRTPLTAMITEMEVTLQKDREQQDYVDTLRSVLDESGKLKTITNGLLELTRTDEYVTREKVRLDELLWDIRTEWYWRNPQQQLDIHMEHLPADTRLLEISGNRDLLQVAIQNIIKNGFKFSEDQPVQCRLECYQDRLELFITDKGIGISAEDLERIFLPLFRADNAQTFDGFGIGLSMADKIVQSHHGSIQVKSVPGEGSTFHLIFFTK